MGLIFIPIIIAIILVVFVLLVLTVRATARLGFVHNATKNIYVGKLELSETSLKLLLFSIFLSDYHNHAGDKI